MATGGHNLTDQDKKVLEKRFTTLKKEQEGFVRASIFKDDPYTSEPFCKHLVLKKLSSRDGKITQESFYGNNEKWQYDSTKDKLTYMFSLIMTGRCITQQVLSVVLSKTLPGYTDVEYKLLSEAMVKTVNPAGNNDKVSLDEFITWITSHISEDELSDALDFQINFFDHQ